MLIYLDTEKAERLAKERVPTPEPEQPFMAPESLNLPSGIETVSRYDLSSYHKQLSLRWLPTTSCFQNEKRNIFAHCHIKRLCLEEQSIQVIHRVMLISKLHREEEATTRDKPCRNDLGKSNFDHFPG